MKKLTFITICMLLLCAGCGKVTKEDIVAKFNNNVKNAKSYILKGNMEILSNEETFTYSLEVNYLKDDFYKVTLVNQTNNHAQVILKNKDGLYVVTPTLNKSFKFQSEWPMNSSQSYILASLLNDINNDKELSVEEIDKNYIIKTKVNYPNNAELTYQKLYFDKSMNLEKVEVYNKDDIVNIKVVFTSVNLKGNLKEDEFLLEDLIQVDENKAGSENDDSKEKCENEECDTKSSNILDNIIYPLYIPTETYLSNSEKIDTDAGNRVILTFAGGKNFVLIEEVANASKEFEIIPVYGEPVMLADTIAAKSSSAMYWTSNSVSYYLASSDLSTEEMVTIAESLGNTKIVSGAK